LVSKLGEVVYSFLLSVKASKSDRLLLVLFSRTLVLLKFLVKTLEFGFRSVEQFVMFQNRSMGSRFSVNALWMGFVIFVKDLRTFLVKELFRWNKKPSVSWRELDQCGSEGIQVNFAGSHFILLKRSYPSWMEF
jgi:hypothetical protein